MLTTDLTTEQQLFLAADVVLREVIDQFTSATLALAVPVEWSTMDEVGEARNGMPQSAAKTYRSLPAGADALSVDI